ncbi:MAG: murein biosynthesis integral membrane protein MurJ [Firmicutes bacterium]|nr:murein biosynthesis integral membrane protein MurJ [Bacillota bacterium]
MAAHYPAGRRAAAHRCLGGPRGVGSRERPGGVRQGAFATDTRQFFLAASVIVAGSVGSKILGFIRESCLAAVFGASAATDAYLVASTVPNLIVGVVVGALATTFIPIYTRQRQQDEAGAARLAGDMFLMLALVGVAAGAAVMVWARPLCRFLAPDFPPATFELAARTTLYLAPLPVLLGVNALATSLLQSHYRFASPALAGICQNVALIAAILTLGRWLGITGVAAGLVLGTAAQWVALAPGVRGIPVRAPGLPWRNREVVRALSLALPLLAGGMVGQVAPVVQRVLASGLPEGSLSALNYATLLNGLPTGLTVAALGTVLYPAFSTHTARGDLDGVRALLARGINLSVLVMLPVTVGSLILSTPLVRLAFERGAFDAWDTTATSTAFWFLAWSMVAVVCSDLWRRAFYALEDTTYPTLVGVLGMAVSVLLSFVLVRPLAHAGLAAAVTVTNLVTAALLLVRLRRRLGHLGARQMLDRVAKAGLASLVMGAVVWGADRLSSGWLAARGVPTGSALVEAARLGLLVAGGALVYLAILWLLAVPEMRQAVGLGRRSAAAAWRRTRAILHRARA